MSDEAGQWRRRNRRRDLLALAGVVVLFGLVLVVGRSLLASAPVDEVVSLGGDEADAASGTFVDDDGLDAEPEIERLAEAGVTGGCGAVEDRTFCPEDPVSRASLAIFLDRVLALPDAQVVFDDLAADGAAGAAVGRLAAAGVVSGCGPSDFCPEQDATRGQAALFVDRALDLPDAEPTATDVDGEELRAAVARITAAGLLNNCAGDRFCPDDPITRAEVAELLVRSGLVD